MKNWTNILSGVQQLKQIGNERMLGSIISG